MRTTAEQWGERVRAWRSSGRTAEAFCADEGFTAKTLRWWAGELGRRARAAGASSKSRVALARVVRPGDLAAEARDEASIAVVVGSCTVTVRRGFDADLLREVVGALGEAR